MNKQELLDIIDSSIEFWQPGDLAADEDPETFIRWQSYLEAFESVRPLVEELPDAG